MGEQNPRKLAYLAVAEESTLSKRYDL